MEENKKNYSCQKHKETNATDFCQECKIYMCNKCANLHQELFEKYYHQYNLNKEDKKIFIDICTEMNHPNKLIYFCKTHNKLCCANCITNIQGKGNGQHKDCKICFIENIKDEKKNKLNDNIKFLEDLSNNLENLIKQLKDIFEKMNESKEELKSKIQKIFTKLRNALNEREDKLLFEVDNQYNDLFCDENIIKETENLPNKIKISLEKGKSIDNDWNDNDKLSSIINDCIVIEDNINKISLINENIKKCNLTQIEKIDFIIEDDLINNFIQNIKTFGKIINNKCKFFNFDTLILKNEDELNKFYNLLLERIKINNLKLLYRLSQDGLGFENIKNKINNKSNLIFLFCTGNKRIFGVYISTKLENIEHNKYFKDGNAFSFSLDNNKIYKILIPESAIRFYNINKYPILIGNNGNSNGFYPNTDGTIYDKGLMNNPKIYDFQKNCELTEGINKFTELEIFEISNNN